MPHRGNRRLNDKDIRPCFLGDGPVLLRFLRNRGNCGHNPRLFHLLDSLRNQFLPNRRDIHFLNQVRARLFIRFGNLLQHTRRIFIPGLNTL